MNTKRKEISSLLCLAPEKLVQWYLQPAVCDVSLLQSDVCHVFLLQLVVCNVFLMQLVVWRLLRRIWEPCPPLPWSQEAQFSPYHPLRIRELCLHHPDWGHQSAVSRCHSALTWQTPRLCKPPTTTMCRVSLNPKPQTLKTAVWSIICIWSCVLRGVLISFHIKVLDQLPGWRNHQIAG